ncbi:MAG TPA: cytochrome c oxidase subunit 3 [Candidatus Limnocylindrales bacterium]|jgi:cytochrome c oxidase subunit 3
MAADTTALTPAHAAADAHGSGGIGNPVLGMLLFITSEVMFFAGLFAAYFSIRAQYTEVINNVATHVWPPKQFETILNPFQFQTESGALNVILPATILLVISSFTCQYAVWAIGRDNRTAFLRNMAVTVVLGITFLLLQAYDYTVLFHEGLSMGSTTFGTTYFTLTGFHGAHVFGGVLMLSVVLYRGMAGQFSAKHHDMVEATSLYWHFVDVVWILLFSILYLL